VSQPDKSLVWLHGRVGTPPFSSKARKEAGFDPNAIVVADVFKKTTRTTPQGVIDVCKKRLKYYNDE